MSRRRRLGSLIRWLVLGRPRGLRARLFRALVGRGAAPAAESSSSSPAATPAAARPSLDGWVRVVADSEVVEGEVIEAIAGDRPLVLARVDGQVFALPEACPHAGGPLSEGTLDGATLTCPWHGWSFDVRDGGCAVDPALRATPVELQVIDGFIWAREADASVAS
jgi:nitrite reductase/ring-hydroxylating ferredoxin subunit